MEKGGEGMKYKLFFNDGSFDIFEDVGNVNVTESGALLIIDRNDRILIACNKEFWKYARRLDA